MATLALPSLAGRLRMVNFNRILKRAVYLAAVAFALCFLCPAIFAEPTLFVQSRPSMGTTFTIYLYADNAEKAAEDFEACFDEIERLDDALSNYRPSSELSRINRLAPHQRVITDAEVFALLQKAFEYSKATDGAFDITVGPLMRAWGFFRGQGRYPQAIELGRARKSVGWHKVELDPAHRSIHFTAAGVEIDLGAIGKGYAVDRVVTVLREAGVTAALVNAGSSTIYALGAPPGENGWKVRVPRPGARSEALSTVLLRDASLSTSGSYEKFFQLNGDTYCHIMDPRTGTPVRDMVQTTIIAKDGTTTDALSTSLFVMGPSASRKLLDTMPEVSAIWVRGKPSSPRIESSHWPSCIAVGTPSECQNKDPVTFAVSAPSEAQHK